MHLGISSVITTIIIVSMYIILFLILSNQKFFLHYAGLNCGLFFFLCFSLRCIAPLELPFTHTIYFDFFFTTIRTFLTYKINLHFFSLFMYQILLIIWVTGILLLILRKWLYYKSVRKYVKLFGQKLYVKDSVSLQNIYLSYPEFKNVQVYFCSDIPGPVMIGIKQKLLVLPDTHYEDYELPLIFQHEVLHFQHKDTIWKILIDFLCTIFWWNPLFRLLQFRLLDIMEISVDIHLTNGMTIQQKQNYMDCLLHILKYTKTSLVGSVYFSHNTLKRMRTRLKYIEKDYCQNKISILITYILIIIFFILSFGIIFEPVYPLPNEENIIDFSEMYAIHHDNIYDIYCNGTYLISEENLDLYPENMEVYFNGN